MKKTKIFLIFASAFALFVAVILIRSPLFRRLQKGNRINLLLIGADRVRGGSHADVVLWLSYQPQTRFIDIVSIPRDALIRWDRWIPRKLSEVLYLDTKKFGMKTGIRHFKGELEDFLGFKFDYYAVVTFSAFAHFIDAIGRIPVQIDRPMNYDDNWGNLHIHFKPGKYMFQGADALKYVRFRHSSLGDLGRIQRQHAFLKSVLRKAVSFRTFLAAGKILKIFKEDIYTNLTGVGMVPLLEVIRTADMSKQRYQILPGTPERIVSKDVWKLDKKGCNDVKNTVFDSKMELWPRSRIRPFIMSVGPDSLSGIQAEVFNATKSGGLAMELTKKLRSFGCDIVMWGNWGGYKKHTEVISRTGDYSKASRVARILGCSRIMTDIDSSRMVDVSVVIGTDFPEAFLK